MDALAWLTAIYVALNINMFIDDSKKEPTTTTEVRIQEAQTK
jgi:hypothetical protein